MPKPFGGIESSSFNSKVNPLMNSNFKLNPMSNGNNNSNAVNNSSSNKYTMSPPPLPVHNHHNNNNHHQNNNLHANEYKPSVAFLNSNINQRFFGGNNTNNNSRMQSSQSQNDSSMSEQLNQNQRIIASQLLSEIQSQMQQHQQQQQNNNFSLQQQQQKLHQNLQHFTQQQQDLHHHSPSPNHHPNYLDTNNNSILFNKTMSNLAASSSSSQINKNIGGVINNLINSTITHQQQNGNGFLLNSGISNNGSNGTNLLLNNFNNSCNNINSYADESKCHVCGDKSTGSHFGGISCESCKAFFRRSVQRNRFEDYKCSYSGECKMNTNTRKICQYCRYKQCLNIGMRPKWVLSDDERHQKYGSRRKNKGKVDPISAAKLDDPLNDSLNKKDTASSLPISKSNTDLQSFNANKNESNAFMNNCNSILNNNNNSIKNSNFEVSSSTNSENDASPQQTSRDSSVTNIHHSMQNNEDSNSGNSTRINLSKSGIDDIDMNNLILNSFEKDLIDRLSISFYHSRKYNAVDLNVQKKLASLFQTQNDGSLKKMSKVILANFIVQPVKRVITFAKLLHDFRTLDISDQMSLLQGGAMEVFICTSSSLYDQMANKLVNVVSRDRNIEGNDNSNVQLDILRLIWSESIFDKTIQFFKSMSELKLDEATLILFIPLILFSPDRRDLDDRKRIYLIQSKYSFLLKKYMIWKFGFNGSTIKLYNKLLLKLMELRTLQEMHSSILLDADPSRLEPFSLALITSHKEESSKFKSSESSTAASEYHSESTDHPMSNSLALNKEESQNNHEESSLNTSMQHQLEQINSKPNSNFQANQFSESMSVLTPISMVSSTSSSSNYSGQISSISSVSSQIHNHQSPPHSNENNYSTFDSEYS